MVEFNIDYSGLPEHLQDSIRQYIEDRRGVGDFLTACLENDLSKAIGHADSKNKPLVQEIVVWLYNNAPHACWGGWEKVYDWLNPEPSPEEALLDFVGGFLNGNLSVTKKEFHRYTGSAVRKMLIDTFGCSDNKAALAVEWMRGEVEFQEYCDAD